MDEVDKELGRLGVPMMQINNPICAVCNKHVDRIESMFDLNRDATFFRAYCHGEVEEQHLDALTVISSTEITFGKAFEKPLLAVVK